MFEELVRYTELADSKIIATFFSSEKTIPEAEYLFSHVLNSQHIWISRIKGMNSTFQRFQIHPKTAFDLLFAENMSNLYAILKTDLDQMVKYANPEGGFFENKTSDILIQIINHSTYHRGQVVTMLRQVGFTDVNSTDMTTYFRMKNESSTKVFNN